MSTPWLTTTSVGHLVIPILVGLFYFKACDDDGHPPIFRQKYDRAMKELEYTKRRLQQQREDDVEQLRASKKQLEKKVGREDGEGGRGTVLVVNRHDYYKFNLAKNLRAANLHISLF